MGVRFAAVLRGLVALVVFTLLAPAPVVAQSSSSNAAIPRLADGTPDLQGVWDFASVTPLQRPEEMAGKEFLTDEDVRDVVDYVILLSYRGELENSVTQVVEFDYDEDED